MTPTRLELGSDDPELRIRCFDPLQDGGCVKEHAAAPPFVLEFIRLEGKPSTWAFYRTPAQVTHFHEGIIQDLSKDDLRQNKFDALPESARRARLRGILQKSYEFLASALSTEDLQAFNAAIDELESGSTLRVSNDVDSDGPGLPWPLLQLTPPPGSNVVSADRTLGFRFALTGTLTSFGAVAEWRRFPVGDALSALLDAHAGERAYGFVDDPRLKSVELGSERKALKDRTGPAFDPLHDLPEAPGKDDDVGDVRAPPPGLGSLEQLVDYLADTTRVATHFCCHGQFGATGASSLRYSFVVRNDHCVDAVLLQRSLTKKAASMLARAGRVSSRFLFLNMCRSASSHPQTVSASNALHFLGAEALVSTMGDVCDEAAAGLAVSFYGHALDGGVDVGAALLLTLRSALSSSLNPAYLLFMFRGDSRVRIA